MGAPYSMDLRIRVLAAVDEGGSTSEVAEQFSVSTAWVGRLVQRRRELGRVGPKPPERKPPVWVKHSDRIRSVVSSVPDLTLEELLKRLGNPFGVTTLWRALNSLKLTLKKNRERNRAGPARRGGRAEEVEGPAGGNRPGSVGVPR